MGGIRQLWHVWKNLMSSLRVDPQEAKKKMVGKWDKKGSREGQYYLKTVRILAGKLFPLLQAVVFVDSSEEGELRRRKPSKRRELY